MDIRPSLELEHPGARSSALVSIALVLLAACRGPEVPTHAAIERPEQEPDPQVEPDTARAPISDDAVIEAIVALAAIDSQVDAHLHALAVEIGPRLTGTPQLVEAELWAVDQLESWGLSARREPWGEFPVAFERGRASGAMIRPVREELELGTWAWTPGTRGQDGLEAGGAIRGQALRYPDGARQLRAKKPYLRGAWVLVPHGFERPRGELGRQIEDALERAPIAGLVLAAGGPEDDRISTHGDHRLDPAKLPTRVEIRLRGDQHHGLLERVDAGEYVELEFGVANRLLPGPVPVHNVIAELPGSELPEQRVVIGGHLDSWDGASGAVDNATGVATTLEAARLIAAACERTGQRPRRTLSVQLWTGEEQGLLGSAAWVAAHPDLLEGISAALVHDNGTNYISGLAVTPELHASLAAVFEPVTRLAPDAMPFELSLVEALGRDSSDSDSFTRAGVPGLFWAQAGRSDYARYHHTQYDHADAVIDAYQRHSALVVAIAAWQLAQLPELLDRRNLQRLPPRRLGVELDGLEVVGLAPEALAGSAGIRVGDRLVAVDGVELDSARDLGEALQRGGALEILTVARGEDELELVVDWSADPNEARRAALRAERRERFDASLRPWDLAWDRARDLDGSAGHD